MIKISYRKYPLDNHPVMDTIEVFGDLGYTCDKIGNIDTLNYTLPERLENAIKFAISAGVSTELQVCTFIKEITPWLANEINLPKDKRTKFSFEELKYAIHCFGYAYDKEKVWILEYKIKWVDTDEKVKEWITKEFELVMKRKNLTYVPYTIKHKMLDEEEAEGLAYEMGGGIPDID